MPGQNWSPFSRLGSGEPKGGLLRCDAFGCGETHPLEHDCLGEPSFGTGRFLGWVYLDVNRPDLLDRQLRFCSVRCCLWWLEDCAYRRWRSKPTPLDEALRTPHDETARARAKIGRWEPVSPGEWESDPE